MCGLVLLLSAGVTQLRLGAALRLLQYGFGQFFLHRFGLKNKEQDTRDHPSLGHVKASKLISL